MVENPPRKLAPAAERALAEAAQRRAAAAGEKTASQQAAPKEVAPKEVKGPKGPDPIRYGDWENKGIASDF